MENHFTIFPKNAKQFPNNKEKKAVESHDPLYPEGI